MSSSNNFSNFTPKGVSTVLLQEWTQFLLNLNIKLNNLFELITFTPTLNIVTLATGWSNSNTTQVYLASYIKDAAGNVHFYGTVTGGSGQIFQLPSGFCPLKTLLLPTQSNGAVALVSVSPTGVVSLVSGSAVNLQLSGLIFSTLV